MGKSAQFNINMCTKNINLCTKLCRLRSLEEIKLKFLVFLCLILYRGQVAFSINKMEAQLEPRKSNIKRGCLSIETCMSIFSRPPRIKGRVTKTENLLNLI